MVSVMVRDAVDAEKFRIGSRDFHIHDRLQYRRESDAARAAIAELLAADKEYDEATRAWLDPERDDHAALRTKLNNARARRASALAAVEGNGHG